MASPKSSARDAAGLRDHDEPTETTPLIAAGQLAPEGDTEAATMGANVNSSEPAAKGKPLPYFQIFILCYAR
jgi:hypothetical protein